MTRVVDLHPEELLDRDARGELSPAEEVRLQAHLSRCAACRFERQLRLDFAGELASDDEPSLPSVERLALLGTSMTKRAPADSPRLPAAETAPREDARRPPARRRVSRVSRATWLLAAAAVLAVSVAGATGAGQRAWSRILGEPAPVIPTLSETATPPGHVAAKHAPRHLTAPTPTAIEVAREARVEPLPVPSTLDVLVPSPAAAPLAPVTPTLSVAASHSAGSGSAPAAHHSSRAEGAAHAQGAAALFEAATEARRQGSYARAVELQRELLSRYPRSRESHVAHETLGRLLLDRGDPSGAFASFDTYLAEGSGELGEEAMVGRATALERLGRSAQAVDAWHALLAAYPETPYAAHARSRLGSLSVR